MIPSNADANLCNCMKCLVERDDRVEVNGWKMPISAIRFVVCSICGNKRCPHSDDHDNECTGSNDVGQQGSRYE